MWTCAMGLMQSIYVSIYNWDDMWHRIINY